MFGSNPMAAKNIISFCGSKKTQSLLFLALFLVVLTASFLAVFLSSSVSFHGSKGSLPLIRRTLVEIPSRNEAPVNNNVNLHHQDHVHQTSPTTSTSTFADGSRNERQFQMAAHEVPSGPNPESN